MGGYIGKGQPVSIDDNTVETVDIQDDAVTNAKIATNAVTGDSIASNAVGNSELSDDAVGTAEIADDAVTADKLANSINSEITANTAKTGITTSQANAITANTAKVTNATHTGDVTGATALTIADDAVTAAKLANSINTDIATGVTANTTANAALPKAGGTMTGTLQLTGTSDVFVNGSGNRYVGISSSDGLATMEIGGASGSFIDMKAPYSDDYDMRVGSSGTGGYLDIAGGSFTIGGSGETMAQFTDDGAATLYHNNGAKLATTSAGVTVTGTLAATTLTGDGSSLTGISADYVKIATTGDITSGTSYTIDNCFSSTYHNYKIVYDVKTGGSSSALNYVGFRFRTGGTSGSDLTSTTHMRNMRKYSGHTNREVYGVDRDVIYESYNRLDKGHYGDIDVYRNNTSTPIYYHATGIGTHPGNSECFPYESNGVNHTNNNTITGIRVYLYSGETTEAWSGRMTVYGLKR